MLIQDIITCSELQSHGYTMRSPDMARVFDYWFDHCAIAEMGKDIIIWMQSFRYRV